MICFETNHKLRKWVLKSDITKIRKLIMDGANPNFISQQVPDSKSTNVSFYLELASLTLSLYSENNLGTLQCTWYRLHV